MNGFGEKSEHMADNRKVIASSNACHSEFLVPEKKKYICLMSCWFLQSLNNRLFQRKVFTLSCHLY